jgi:serine/threonine-protein kinase RsbW/stage II sporulation protein AB (anti-sigma F factor)
VSASFEATFPSTPPGVGAIRREIAAFAQHCGMSPQGVDAVRLAVSEAATNAVIHAYRDSEGDLSVRAGVENGELVVVVADRGIGLAPRGDSPGLGLGMPLMASVTSHFRVVSRGAGTEVHMAFPLDGSGRART